MDWFSMGWECSPSTFFFELTFIETFAYTTSLNPCQIQIKIQFRILICEFILPTKFSVSIDIKKIKSFE